MYLTNTTPNITYVVSHLGQYVAAPTKDHLQATFRVLRYLKQTISDVNHDSYQLGNGFFFLLIATFNYVDTTTRFGQAVWIHGDLLHGTSYILENLL